jgi:hypothetical protein
MVSEQFEGRGSFLGFTPHGGVHLSCVSKQRHINTLAETLASLFGGW